MNLLSPSLSKRNKFILKKKLSFYKSSLYESRWRVSGKFEELALAQYFVILKTCNLQTVTIGLLPQHTFACKRCLLQLHCTIKQFMAPTSMKQLKNSLWPWVQPCYNFAFDKRTMCRTIIIIKAIWNNI